MEKATTNALELRLDAVENELRGVREELAAHRADAAARDERLIRSVEAVEKFLAAHEDHRKFEAANEKIAARVAEIEALCPECPRRSASTPPPGGG